MCGSPTQQKHSRYRIQAAPGAPSLRDQGDSERESAAPRQVAAQHCGHRGLADRVRNFTKIRFTESMTEGMWRRFRYRLGPRVGLCAALADVYSLGLAKQGKRSVDFPHSLGRLGLPLRIVCILVRVPPPGETLVLSRSLALRAAGRQSERRIGARKKIRWLSHG